MKRLKKGLEKLLQSPGKGECICIIAFHFRCIDLDKSCSWRRGIWMCYEHFIIIKHLLAIAADKTDEFAKL